MMRRIRYILLLILALQTYTVMIRTETKKSYESTHKRISDVRPYIWIYGGSTNDDITLFTTEGDFMYTELTVVTALFDIGTFPKGLSHWFRKFEEYLIWMAAFGSMDNPLIVFTDKISTFNKFIELRKNFPKSRTKVILIDKWKLWSFSIAGKIKEIHDTPDYPQHWPHTVHENYSCLTHSKMELMQMVVKDRLRDTKYLSWVDVGIYRREDYSEIFHVRLPASFNESRVLFSKIWEFANYSVEDIILQNKNWVGGGMMMGRWDNVLSFTQDYLQAVQKLLEMRIMNVEQQVIFAMYSNSSFAKPRVEIQAINDGRVNDWQCLARITRVKGYYNNTAKM